MCNIFFIQSLIDEHLGCFQSLTIMNNSTMNILEQMSLWYNYVSSGYMPKSSIAWSWDRLTQIFWENAILFSKVTIKVCNSISNGIVLPYSNPFQQKLSSVFLVLDSLICVKWYLKAILIYICLMAKDFEQFLKFLSVFFSSIENFLFISVLHF